MESVITVRCSLTLTLTLTFAMPTGTRGAQGAQPPNGQTKKRFFVIIVTDILKISKNNLKLSALFSTKLIKILKLLK